MWFFYSDCTYKLSSYILLYKSADMIQIGVLTFIHFSRLILKLIEWMQNYDVSALNTLT